MKNLTKKIGINLGNRISNKIYFRVSTEVFRQISHQVEWSIGDVLFEQICIHSINEIANEEFN